MKIPTFSLKETQDKFSRESWMTSRNSLNIKKSLISIVDPIFASDQTCLETLGHDRKMRVMCQIKGKRKPTCSNLGFQHEQEWQAPQSLPLSKSWQTHAYFYHIVLGRPWQQDGHHAVLILHEQVEPFGLVDYVLDSE
jgi:hypothetical protein